MRAKISTSNIPGIARSKDFTQRRSPSFLDIILNGRITLNKRSTFKVFKFLPVRKYDTNYIKYENKKYLQRYKRLKNQEDSNLFSSMSLDH